MEFVGKLEWAGYITGVAVGVEMFDLTRQIVLPGVNASEHTKVKVRIRV